MSKDEQPISPNEQRVLLSLNEGSEVSDEVRNLSTSSLLVSITQLL